VTFAKSLCEPESVTVVTWRITFKFLKTVMKLLLGFRPFSLDFAAFHLDFVQDFCVVGGFVRLVVAAAFDHFDVFTSFTVDYSLTHAGRKAKKEMREQFPLATSFR
jgi:hypothetical protein